MTRIDAKHPSSSLSSLTGAETLSSPTWNAQPFRDLVAMTRIRLNSLVLVTTAVGFALGAIDQLGGLAAWWTLIHTLIGTAICGCAGSVLNQWIERRTDHLMERTADRPLPAGRISSEEALWFGAILSIVGVTHLALLVNALAAVLAFATILLYALVYTPMKYRSWTCTIIGAVPGAIPPMIGWAGARGSIGIEAVVLFFILFAWQLPHFYAIGSIYRTDYARAGIRILPVVDDSHLTRTVRQTFGWTILLSIATIWPVAIGYFSIQAMVIILVLNAAQLVLARRFAQLRTRDAARTFFLWTIMYLPVLLAVIVADVMLHASEF